MTSPVISADSHVVEPPTLWQDRLPKKLRERGPRLSELNGFSYIVIDVNGKPFPLVSAEDHKADASADGERYDPSKRLDDVGSDGVWGEVLYPTVGLFAWSMPDPEMAVACARVYNDWMAETFAGFTDRLLPGAMIPARAGVKESVAEIERAATLGLRFAMLPIIPPKELPYYKSDWEPVWAAAQDHSLPISFHAASGIDPTTMTDYDPAKSDMETIQRRGIGTMVRMVAQPAHALLDQLVVGKVFDKYPELKFVIVETQIGWLAWVLEEFDRAVDNPHSRELLKLEGKPSDYVRRQVGVTFMDDSLGLKNRDITGCEPLMWGSDYPHPEGTWPNTQATLDKQFAGIPDAERQAITGGNLARMFGMKLPAAI